MTRIPSIASCAASALVLVSFPAVATAPIKVKVEGKSAYAEFLHEDPSCPGTSTYAYAAYQESQSVEPTRSFRFVGLSFHFIDACNPDVPYIYGHGASDIADPSVHLVREISDVDMPLAEGTVQAIMPVRIDGYGMCTATIDLFITASKGPRLTTAGVVHQWRHGYKYINRGMAQPGVAAGRITIGPLLMADGSSVPCELPVGVPLEYAIGDSLPNGAVPTTFLAKTKTTDFYRVMD